jgi:hypothetical protein
MRGVQALAASALAALVGFGCNSILGIDKASLDPSFGTGGTGTGGSGTGGFPLTCDVATGDTPCTLCEKTACCPQTTACAGNSDCTSLVSCVTACGNDTNCASACATSYPGGATTALDLANCVNTSCSSTCTSGQTCGAALDVDPTLVRSCVLGMSCDPYPATDISSCITLAYVDALPFLSCQYGANTCDDIGKCTGEYYADSSVCTAGTGWVCNGNVAHNCDATPMVVDCSFWGGTCTPGTAWPCTVPIGGCPVADTGWHCSGDYAYTCVNGVPQGYSCAVQAGVCAESTPGQGGCTLSTAKCATPNQQLCNGNSLTYCNPSGYFYQYDCSVIGGTCQTSASGSGYCFSPGCTPDSTCTESCSGSVMTLCIGRAPMQVDCTQYGFSACTSKTDTSGYTTVSCIK